MGSDPPVRIMSALIIRAIVEDHVLPKLFEAGTPVEMVWDPTAKLMQRIADGERADGIVAIDTSLDELEGKGLIEGSSRRRFAQAAFGLAVARGAPRPNISTVDKLRSVLLESPRVVYSRAGASGMYFERLIDELGIGAPVREKALIIPAGLTGQKVASGEAVIAVQQISELLAVPEIDLIGPFPAPVQETTNFSAALFKGSANAAGSNIFFDVLFSPDVRSACEVAGLKPFFE
jgi:molybdate transport system substrate-binding protein